MGKLIDSTEISRERPIAASWRKYEHGFSTHRLASCPHPGARMPSTVYDHMTHTVAANVAKHYIISCDWQSGHKHGKIHHNNPPLLLFPHPPIHDSQGANPFQKSTLHLLRQVYSTSFNLFKRALRRLSLYLLRSVMHKAQTVFEKHQFRCRMRRVRRHLLHW